MKNSTRYIALAIILLPLFDLYLALQYGQTIFSPIEWFLVIGAALSLLIQHKLSWVIGILFMACFISLMVYQRLWMDGGDGEAAAGTAQFLGAMIGLYVIIVMLYFFRYPYLDRRQRWFGPTAVRYLIETPVIINGTIDATTADLSYVGARIAMPATGEKLQSGEAVSLLFPQTGGLQFTGVIVAIEEGFLRVNFDKEPANTKKHLRKWLRRQNAPKF